MTSGAMLPLMTADMLAMTIVGSVLENMDMERLIAGELNNALAYMSSPCTADSRKRSACRSPSGSRRRARRWRVWRRLRSEFPQMLALRAARRIDVAA